MHVINWLAPHITEVEARTLCQLSGRVTAARNLRQVLASSLLEQYPWQGRTDLIPVYQPDQSYDPQTWLALPVFDPQGLRPMAWRVAYIVQVQHAENPSQGSFDVLIIKSGNKQFRLVASLAGVQVALPTFSLDDREGLAWLSAWVADAYARPLQSRLERLARQGLLPGRFVGESFVRDDLPLISDQELASCFRQLSTDHPWLGLVGIQSLLSDRPELANLPQDVLFPLLRAALQASPYHPLGGDRWTTHEIFEQLNREVLRGLPVPRVRSRLNYWTKKDEQDLADQDVSSLPEEARDDWEAGSSDEQDDYEQPEWRAPSHPIALHTLSYLHITQAYFPVGDMITAFHPDVHMLFVQVIEGDRQPFLVDRHAGVLKALDIEQLRTAFLQAGIPAGTHLWLEYQGAERYRIAPRPLPFPRIVPCKLAFIHEGQLHIEQTEIEMQYEGDSSVFKAELRFEDIEALFEEARRSQLSVLDAIIQSVQDLCAVDPQQRAHRLDIFNAVFLKRMCSPNSVNVLLYTRPCFEQLGNGYFRYVAKPLAVRPRQPRRTRKASVPVIEIPVPPPVFAKPSTPIQPRPEPAPTSEPGLDHVTPPVYSEPETGVPEVQVQPPALAIEEVLVMPPPTETHVAPVPEELPAKIIPTMPAVDTPLPDIEPPSVVKPQAEQAQPPAAVPITSPVAPSVVFHPPVDHKPIPFPRRIWSHVRARVSRIWHSLWRQHVR